VKRWPYAVEHLPILRIQMAVDDPGWQRFRKSLKGLTTEDKLKRLDEYWNEIDVDETEIRPRRVRVMNYINALRRGGQLNDRLEVVK